VVALSAPVLALPLIGSLPDHPPEALQLVALLEDQLSVEAEPLLNVAGVTDRVTVGLATGAVTVTAKFGNEAEVVPSLTLIRMPE
jgi:hypothetical protein